MADPYSPVSPLSSGADRKRGKMQQATYFETEILLLIREGIFSTRIFIHAGYPFSFCGFYFYKMYIDKKKIPRHNVNTPVNVRFSFLRNKMNETYYA